MKNVAVVYLYCRCKTKLAASLARYRVKQRLQSVSCFLSDSVRTKQDRAKHLPLYAWVNTLKTRYIQTHTYTHSSNSIRCKNCKRCSPRKKHPAFQLEPLFVLCAFQSAIFIHSSFLGFSSVPRLLLQGLTAVYLHKSRERLFLFQCTNCET